jgi:hypothetical protein
MPQRVSDYLEHCPWCDAPCEIKTNDDGGQAPWIAAWVKCSRGRGCEAEGPVVKLSKSGDASARAEAAEAWNSVATARRELAEAAKLLRELVNLADADNLRRARAFLAKHEKGAKT